MATPIPQTTCGPQGTHAPRRKDFRSVSSCCRFSEVTKAPVEGEEHALDVDIDIVAAAEAVAPPITAPIKVAVIVEVVETGETIVAADRQGIVGEVPLDAAHRQAVGSDVVVMVEDGLIRVDVGPGSSCRCPTSSNPPSRRLKTAALLLN
jgi:hypothetical protein